MKLLKPLFFFYLLIYYSTVYAQNIKMTKAVKETIELGKDAIVQQALELIDAPVTRHDFTNITVTTDGQTIYVAFTNPIKYIPLNSVFYFDFVVNLLEQVVTYSPVSNNFHESDKPIPVYKQTAEIKQHIQFVLDAISNNLDSAETLTFDDGIEIREHEDYYSILIVSEFQESTYKVDKQTGKLFDAEHAHLAPIPVFENEKQEFIEIN